MERVRCKLQAENNEDIFTMAHTGAAQWLWCHFCPDLYRGAGDHGTGNSQVQAPAMTTQAPNMLMLFPDPQVLRLG